MISEMLGCLSRTAKHRVWVISDLQQSDPAAARVCLTTAVEDFKTLNLACERIWYLGDAVEGEDMGALREMCAMQGDLLGSLRTPVCYVMGNHDFDYVTRRGRRETWERPPFWETVRQTPGWRTTESPESFYFLDELGDYRVVFLSDHADPGGLWVSTHGIVHGDASHYPYRREDYAALREVIAGAGRPVITAGHYAFAGGNRPSELLGQMMPLPENLRLHLYAHAHIGDAAWAGKDLYRKIAGIDWHKAPQVDVASLENRRGNEIRSVLFEVYPDDSFGLYFRDHGRRAWAEAYVLSAKR